MANTKVGKKIVSLVLALTMLFTVATAAVSASARGLGENTVDALVLTSPVTTAGAKTTTLAKRGAEDLLKVQTLTNLALLNNPVTQVGRYNEALLPLQAINTAQILGDNLIIKNDALLFGISSVALGVNALGIRNNNREILGLALVNAFEKFDLLGIPGIVPHRVIGGALGALNLLQLPVDFTIAGANTLANLAILNHAVTHLGLLPLTHINGLLLTQAGTALGTVLALKDVNDLILDGAYFNTPFRNAIVLFNNGLIAANIVDSQFKKAGVLLNVAGQATGATSIALGKVLALHNLGDYIFRNPIRALVLKNARNFVDFSILHATDNFIHNALFAAAVAVPVATATGVIGLTALNAGALGLAGLTVANVAGAAALAAPVAGAAIATPVALGAGALGLGGLAAAGLAGAAALAAPVVATAVAAPVVGAAALGTAAAGAAALGAGALGAAALAANVLGNKDGSTTNPVDTVKNAVESVVPSNNQTTTTTATESTENTQNDNTQAQTTSSNTGSNVANTDGPMD